MQGFTKHQVEVAIRKFRDFAEDVQSSEYTTFDNNFNLFIHHCENDAVMKIIIEPLKHNPNLTFKDWQELALTAGGSFIGSRRYSLPKNEDDRLSIMYQLFLAFLNEELSLSEFCVEFYGKTNYNEMIYVFNEQLFGRFVRDVSYKLDELIASIRDEDEVQEKKLTLFYIDKQVNISNVQGSMIAVDHSSIDASTIRSETDLVKAFSILMSELLQDGTIKADSFQRLIGVSSTEDLHAIKEEIELVQSVIAQNPTVLSRLTSLFKDVSKSLVGSALYELVKLLVT